MTPEVGTTNLDNATQTKIQAKPIEERQTNCLGCGKPIKKLKRYYRNGKYYCNKKCWHNWRKGTASKEKGAKK